MENLQSDHLDTQNLYRDMQKRTGGEIYIGVVGPVRTGKSTFIKRFMDVAVLPYMEDAAQKTPHESVVFSYIYRHFSIQKVRKTGFFGQRDFGRDRRHFRDAAGRFYELV